MDIQILHSPSSTVAKCILNQSESITAESGALMAYNGAVDVTTSTHTKSGGGILKGLKRMLSGESFFINHFSAIQNSEIWFGTPLPGDMKVIHLNGERLIVAGGAWVASAASVDVDLKWQGMKSILSGENMFWIQCQGVGPVLLSSFGFIYEVSVNGEYIVDTGHIVAFEPTLDFSISKSSQNWLDSFLSGEGFVCRFKGQGKVWCQSHNPTNFGYELRPYLKPKKQ